MAGDEDDSRTASVGQARSRRGQKSDSRSQSNSRDRTANRRRTRVGGRPDGVDVRDFVPQGTSFSSAPLDVDKDSVRGSSSEQSDDDAPHEERPSEQKRSPIGQQPAVNWNKSSKSAIRTTLGGKRSKTSGFRAVNDQFWRSRSGSVSSQNSEKQGDPLQPEADNGNLEDGSDSSSSGELSENDDDIVLNLDGKDTDSAMREPAGDSPNHTAENGFELLPLQFEFSSVPSGTSKEAALRIFGSRYSVTPATLEDLHEEDHKNQLKYIYHPGCAAKPELSVPARCTNCLKEGHLADVCPDKECQHCGAWAIHDSRFCPSWRRCQKCRERGHDKDDCNAKLFASALEVPCDFCGSHEHLEYDCDMMWKVPWIETSPGPILVSISCANCTSGDHLVGDCPLLSSPIKSSTWTLKGCDRSMITNLNSVAGKRDSNGAKKGFGSGLKIKGRSQVNQRSPTPESEDGGLIRSNRLNPTNKDRNRPSIRVASGIGRSRDFAGDDQVPRFDYNDRGNRGSYRDRDNYSGNYDRQRSLSPYRERPGRGGDSWQPSNRPRSPPRGSNGRRGGRGGGPPPSRGRGNRSRGGSKDAYRPMPSAGKKAWNKHRF